MSQHGKTRSHLSLNDNKKCVGTGNQGVVVWLSKEEVAVKDREQKAAFNKIHHKDNREKIIKRKKEYRKDNSEQINEYAKQYRKDNSEQINEQQKQYREDHKIEAQQYREDHSEQINEYAKQYRKDNSERLQEQRNENRKQDREAYELIKKEGGLDIKAITREINAGYSLIRAKVLAAKEGQISIYIMAGGSGRFCGENGGGYSEGSTQHGKYT